MTENLLWPRQSFDFAKLCHGPLGADCIYNVLFNLVVYFVVEPFVNWFVLALGHALRLLFDVLQDLKDYMRQAGEVTYADAHKQRRNEG